MSVTFPFKDGGKNTFGAISRPVAKVSFKSPKENIWIETQMLVDTGADFTILPRFLARNLRISLENDCRHEQTTGIGGDQLIYLYKKKIHIKIGHLERNVPIAFFDNNEAPPLLGRTGFLETFNTEFLKSHQVVFND